MGIFAHEMGVAGTRLAGGGMKASPNQWFSLAQGCRIAFVCDWLRHTPPRKGAYVAPEPTGGRFCYRGFGRFRVKPGMRQRRARIEGLGSILRQAQGPPLPPSALRIGHKYGRARIRTLGHAHLILAYSLSLGRNRVQAHLVLVNSLS